MSGIFGIFNRNGNPIAGEIVDAMLKAGSSWEADESDVWLDGAVVLGHAMLWNTPESKSEHFPLRQDVHILTMDARIDNRQELSQKLELPQRPVGEIGDGEFILAAYEKWGEICPKYLVGDFAFALWDENKRQLFCARDHVGVKPLYFHLDAELFVFANDLRVLTTHPGISSKINDEALANYLINHELISQTLTFFADIKKLPPAHTLTITARGHSERCYWRPEDSPGIKLPSREAYAEKLRELIDQAVHDRMRSAYPVTAHLSGGLDSSTIAVIAARKLRKQGDKLLAFNWLHNPTGDDDPTHYEWFNSKLIAELEDIDHHYVSFTVEDICHHIDKLDIVYGETDVFWYEYPIRDAAEKNGSRTILSGWGGDELISYHGLSYFADLFLQGRIGEVFNELKVGLKGRRGIKPWLSTLYHRLLIPLTPRALYCKMPKIKCENRSFPLVKRSFLPMINRELRKPEILTMQPQKTIREHMLAYWQNGHIQSRIEFWATAAIPKRLEYSYPLLDKRIIEFALGVPPELFISNGVRRHLFRSAIKGILPEQIVWSNAKNEPNRVERLVSLFISSCKFFTESASREHHSQYVDGANLLRAMESLQLSSMDLKFLTLVEDIEASMFVLFSEELAKREK